MDTKVRIEFDALKRALEIWQMPRSSKERKVSMEIAGGEFVLRSQMPSSLATSSIMLRLESLSPQDGGVKYGEYAEGYYPELAKKDIVLPAGASAVDVVGDNHGWTIDGQRVFSDEPTLALTATPNVYPEPELGAIVHAADLSKALRAAAHVVETQANHRPSLRYIIMVPDPNGADDCVWIGAADGFQLLWAKVSALIPDEFYAVPIPPATASYLADVIEGGYYPGMGVFVGRDTQRGFFALEHGDATWYWTDPKVTAPKYHTLIGPVGEQTFCATVNTKDVLDVLKSLKPLLPRGESGQGAWSVRVQPREDSLTMWMTWGRDADCLVEYKMPMVSLQLGALAAKRGPRFASSHTLFADVMQACQAYSPRAQILFGGGSEEPTMVRPVLEHGSEDVTFVWMPVRLRGWRTGETKWRPDQPDQEEGAPEPSPVAVEAEG